ncbi:MAG: DUF6144 family protein [Candidatus Delongbacteria bacterium]|jgi:hypothetical protein|nr:DUF6144 family protein [Candidatus Delongbacteria bacterium]
MTDPFEKQWMNKLFSGIKKAEVCTSIDSEKVDENLIEKTKAIIDILKNEFSSDEIKDIMTGCACVRPHAELDFLRQEYLSSKDIGKVHRSLQEYFEETDDNMKKFRYCHCPRVRKMFKSGSSTIDPIYCYCGGGFYKDMWEFILGRRVKIELIKALTNNDDECRYRIILN